MTTYNKQSSCRIVTFLGVSQQCNQLHKQKFIHTHARANTPEHFDKVKQEQNQELASGITLGNGLTWMSKHSTQPASLKDCCFSHRKSSVNRTLKVPEASWLDCAIRAFSNIHLTSKIQGVSLFFWFWRNTLKKILKSTSVRRTPICFVFV